jgi:two-component system NarL family sensor kinase
VKTTVRRLLLAVRDDGGPGDMWTPGVGIASMRERALQVGGTLKAYATTGGGVVEAAMPLGASD